VDGKERDLQVEQQSQGKREQGEPAYRVEEAAEEAAALRAGERLHEEEAVELQAQRVGAQIGALEQAQRVVELQRLARKQDELGDQPQMHKRQERGREDEEAHKIDADLQERQHHAAVEERIACAMPPPRPAGTP
jgi:hypothetical protein